MSNSPERFPIWIALFGFLQIQLIVLKLLDLIDLSWMQVCIPFILYFGIVVLAILFIGIQSYRTDKELKKRYEKKNGGLD